MALSWHGVGMAWLIGIELGILFFMGAGDGETLRNK